MSPTVLDFDRCYAASSGRDARFDGQFVLAVRSTGIYCRPSCPARTPKREHCTFYVTSAAAHLAGYRACKRCLPEAVPGSPEWNVREDVAARGMRLISEGVVDREGVTGLAHRLGYSERQLSRILVDELGAPPLALARAQRAQTARHLLVATAMPVSDVAFAAGFTSIRQFNDTIVQVFAMTPTQLRGTARAQDRTEAAATSGSLSLRLRAREPFDGAAVIDWLGARAIDGLERSDAGGFERAVRLAGGLATVVARPACDHLAVTARLEHLADLPELLARMRRLFDLDADPLAIDQALAEHPLLAREIATHPGTRLPGTVDATEVLVRAILGQQVSVAAARTAVQRVVDALGVALPAALATEHVRVAFPSAAAIAEQAEHVVRGPAGRRRALTEAMAPIASGALTLDSSRTLSELTRDLEALPGIGPWTSQYVALRVLGHPDLLLTGDSAVRAGAKRLGLPHEARPLAGYAERHRPWRSYLMMHLWQASAARKEP
ncbi:AlkA N-terminal domain-containing protein [Demequina activiva]|uniref:DNA-3-methyladenine glycosylase II n=1 Tax=Demequina activiva TaxID=1582364 RepID=A0A919Q2E3_9MICO|nr:AlkA N-terminal domain-containing protein [Demequina activiva]GIG55020.1 DNA-3-methyladenine glycosylase [Demequina activiva]